MVSHAALIGTSDAIDPHLSLDSLAAGFSLSKISTAPARFDLEELKGFNARLLHKLPYEAVSERLAAAGVGGGQVFWETARPNIAVFGDIARWWAVVSGAITPVLEDPAFTAKAAELLPNAPWSGATWGEWTNAIKAAISSRALSPIRSEPTATDETARGPWRRSRL